VVLVHCRDGKQIQEQRVLTDRFHARHTSECPAAIAAFEDAVHAVAAHRPLGMSLTQALAADPGLIAAHALAGFGHIMLGRGETMTQAADYWHAARRAADSRRTLSATETALTDALERAVAGHLRGAAERLELHLESAPEDFLCAKIAHALRFMLGDRDAMLRLTGDLVKRAPESGAGYGFLLGCHAFGLEEAGAYAEAEAAGKRAVRIEPADSWGLHAVSHVFEMTGRVDEGCEWLNASRPVWSRCNNFAYHMAWHLALLHLENRDHEKVLALYDEEIRPVQTDDFRDMSNAVSLLWRLEQEGADVGDRWPALYDIARRRLADTTYIFASLHYLLALIASGDMNAAEELVDALRRRKADTCDQGRVARYIGLPVARALIQMPGQCARAGPCLTEMARRLPALGGSHAQRDVFLRSLMAVAVRSQDYPSLRAIDEIRGELRHEDHFHRAITARMDGKPPASLAGRGPLHGEHTALVRLI
jgi:tetratricopeptide (TPR) repeat protein